MTINITLAHKRIFLLRPGLAVIIFPSEIENTASSSAVVFFADTPAAIIQGRALARMGQAGTTRDERGSTGKRSFGGDVPQVVQGGGGLGYPKHQM